jgi:flagellin-specific chaperone FliS
MIDMANSPNEVSEAALIDIRQFLESAEAAFRKTQALHFYPKQGQTRELKEIINKLNNFLHDIEHDDIIPSRLDALEQFSVKQLIPAFEELAIPQVALRRRMNNLRKDMFRRMKHGRGMISFLWKFPVVVTYEVAIGIIYMITTIRQRPPSISELQKQANDESFSS